MTALPLHHLSALRVNRPLDGSGVFYLLPYPRSCPEQDIGSWAISEVPLSFSLFLACWASAFGLYVFRNLLLG
jgi:hypothetical protein